MRIISFIVLCIFVASIQGRRQFTPLFKDSLQKCADEAGFKLEEFRELKKQNDSRVQCIFQCTLMKEEILDQEGKFSEEKAKEKILPLVKEEEDKERASKFLSKCAAKLNQSSVNDPCKKGNFAWHCLHKALHKGPPKKPNQGNPPDSKKEDQPDSKKEDPDSKKEDDKKEE